MNQVQVLENLLQEAKAIYSNIEWNLGGLVGLAILIVNPKVLYLAQVPMRIDIEGLSIDGFQSLGLALLEKDRQPRANEIVAAAKRSLVCEGLELCADFLARASRVSTSGTDPYEVDEYFSVDIRELWNLNSGRAGSLVEPAERSFLEHCAAPLRNYIRHNNGILPPKKSINYSGQPRNKPINISFNWKREGPNNINLPLSVAYDIFATIHLIVEDGMTRSIANAKSSASP